MNVCMSYKIFHYNRVYVSEGIDINKSNKLKEYMIYHYWYFKDTGYIYEPEIWNGCHDISMMAYELENTAYNVKEVDHITRIWCN